jgi:hypothetical protein
VPVAGLVEQPQGPFEVPARLVVPATRSGGRPQVEESVRFPARVTEGLREGERLLQSVGGLLVLSSAAYLCVTDSVRRTAG